MSGAATRVAFRVDSSLAIGTGHLVRCLTLAEELRRQGCECVFVCRELPGARLDSVRQRGFGLEILPAPSVAAPPPPSAPLVDAPPNSGWLGVEPEVDALESLAVLDRSPSVGRLVVDHYSLDAGWESRLRPAADGLLVIDDIADRPHDCDWLLDQNLHTWGPERYEPLLPSGSTILFGPEYALLRPQFAKAHSAQPGSRGTPRVHVFFGGTDLAGMTEKALAALSALPNPPLVDVVVGAGNPRLSAIERACASIADCRLFVGVSDMASLMSEADIALGSGGTTTWERACLGLPALVVSIADNQVDIAEAAARSGICEYLGKSEDVKVEDIAVRTLALLADPVRLETMSQRARSLVDGRGAERVAVEVGACR